MTDQDTDWLDDKLGVNNYIPDDGFSARVVDQLPQAWLSNAESMRRGILILCGFFAAGVAVGMLAMQIGPLKQAVSVLLSRSSMMAALNHFMLMMHEPVVLYSVSGGLFILAFAAIPLLRRWV
jgi:hypothetical protein